MRLVFFKSTPALDAELKLTVYRSGMVALNAAATAALRVQPGQHAALCFDEEGGDWYFCHWPAEEVPHPQVRRYKQKGTPTSCIQSSAAVRVLLGAQKERLDVLHCWVASAAREDEHAPGARLYLVRPLSAGGAPMLPAAAPSAPELPAPSDPTPPVQEPVAAATPPAEPEAASTAPAESAPTTPESDAGADPTPAASTQQVAGKYSAEMDARLLDPANSPSELAREWGVSAAALHSRRAMLKKKSGLAPGQDLPVVAAPSGPQLVYTPAPAAGEEPGAPVRKTFGLHARAEELTATWAEREMGQASPNELAELLNLLRHVPADKRGVEMQLVLDRAELEHSRRLTAAGKGGRNA